ncbi:unnamed protein product [Coffea canephora]|uniref:Uncharacterized protein n=1 Tax=Coffea canephora TaxID=49390 RepID=A0A068TTR5_COFCA|nr:unnamed protein product [Coffea canephora]
MTWRFSSSSHVPRMWFESNNVVRATRARLSSSDSHVPPAALSAVLRDFFLYLAVSASLGLSRSLGCGVPGVWLSSSSSVPRKDHRTSIPRVPCISVVRISCGAFGSPPPPPLWPLSLYMCLRSIAPCPNGLVSSKLLRRLILKLAMQSMHPKSIVATSLLIHRA